MHSFMRYSNEWRPASQSYTLMPSRFFLLWDGFDGVLDLAGDREGRLVAGSERAAVGVDQRREERVGFHTRSVDVGPDLELRDFGRESLFSVLGAARFL